MRIRALAVPLLSAAVVLLAADIAAAQSHPTVDGSIGPGEYSLEKQDGALRLYASFDEETIYLAVAGRTKGWVAIGVDSARMDGAKIFMGYFANGEGRFSTQSGVRHSHREASSFSARSHAVRESSDTTTMEIALDRRVLLDPTRTTLEVIYAMGSGDSFGQYHEQRGSTSLTVN